MITIFTLLFVSSAVGAAAVATAEVKADTTPPALTLSGTLTEQGTLGTKSPTYTLEVQASDGSAKDPQSGVARVVIEVDGKVVDETSPGCATENCSISREWTLVSSKYSTGQHTAEVTATDAAGLTTTQKLSIELQPAPPPGTPASPPKGGLASLSASTAGEIAVLPILDPLNRTESPLSGGGKWSALAWDNSTSGHNTGRDTTSGWGPSDSYPTINGAYWNPSTFNDKTGNAAAITMQTGPGNASRYVALWLDMSSPGSAKSGYQLRWTVNSGSSYTVKLSKWSAGTETVLASNASVTIATGTTMAISDTGGTVTAWQGTSGSFTSLLSAEDTTYSHGYAGIEGSGSNSHSLNFKAGVLLGEAINGVPVLDDLERQEVPLATGKWSKTSWAGEMGGAWCCSYYRGYGSSGSSLASAYWNQTSFSDAQGGVITAATVGTGSPWEGEYLALWLDMPNPGGARSGYEARFTGVNGSEANYKVELSKWVSGTRTVLASTTGFSLPTGTTMALTEAGGSVVLWTGTGSFTPLLSATDSTYSSGYSGLEVNGGAGTEYNFRAGSISVVGERLAGLPVTEPFDGSTESLANFGSKWSTLGWAGGGTPKGSDTTTGWRPVDAYSAVNGTYYNPTVSDTGPGIAAVATMAANPNGVSRYFSLWLDMPTPSSTRAGYELRFTDISTNTYEVKLSKWVSGTQTVLATKSSYSFSNGNSFALVDQAGTVSAWTDTGSGFAQLLSASDATFSGGNAGVEGSGNNTRLTNFKLGSLGNAPPDTTISGGPKGVVVPNVSFSFTSSETGSSFECSLDGAAYGACTSPYAYQGLTEGAHTFRVRAVGTGGPDATPAERSFEVVEAAKAATKVRLWDNLERQEVPLATGKWSKANWAGEIGGAWCCGYYHGYGSSGSTLAGAYWNPTSFSDGEGTTLVAAIVGTGSTPEGQYLALWLDMPSPGNARSGYEARFTGVNGSSSNYKVELSKWVSGTRTILASTTGFSLPVGTVTALSETAGGSLTLWTGTSTLSPALTANDTTYTSGYAGLEVNGGAGTEYDFRAGRIDIQAPDTTIQSGPSGIVPPQDVSFTFTATETDSSFECAIDGGTYSACSSPKSYTSLAAGPHTFRVRAVDAVGNQDETPAERNFEVAKPPAVSTGGASGITPSEATLHGSVNPNGIETTYQFEYGPTAAHGNVAPAVAKGAGSGSQAVAVEQLVTGLEAATTYHFRIAAANGSGTSYGSDETFTTAQQSPVRLLVFGQAAEASPGTLVSPEQPLSISAGDEGGKIEEVQLRLDGEVESTATRQEALEEGGTESCSEGVCTLSFEYPSAFSPEAASGQHTFEVRAIGEGGKEATFTRQVLVDAGVPTLELGGSLVEANGNLSSSYSSATVTAKVQDGTGSYDSGLSSIKFYVDGTYQSGMSAQCNGGCPAEGSSSYEYLQSEWGTGPHELTVVAMDAAGNETSDTVMINRHLASIEPTCSEAKATAAAIGKAVSTTEATEAVKATLPAAVAPATPDPEAEGFEPTLTDGKAASEGGEAFLAKGGLVGGRVTRGSRRAFTIGQASCLVPMQTTEAESAPEVLAASGAVVYANTAPETDTFFRNNGVGATIVESFRGPSAPTDLSWTISLKSGQRLEKLGSGAVAIVSSKGLDIPEAQLPSPPAGMDDPEKLGDTKTVLAAASYQLRRANNEVKGAVEAVIPPALVITSSGAVEEFPLTVAEGERVVATVPSGAKAMVMRTDSSPQPEAVCAAAFEDDPADYANGCLPEKNEGGERPYITGMDWSPNGSFIYTAFWDEYSTYYERMNEYHSIESFLYRASADGSEIEQLETPGFKVLGAPKVSPDGTKIVFNGCSLVSFKCGVVLSDASGENGTLLIATGGHFRDSRMGFSGDGSRILYEEPVIIDPNGREERQIYSMRLDGTEKRQLTDLSFFWAITRTEPYESWEGRGVLQRSAVAADPTSDTLVLEGGGAGFFYAMHESQEKADTSNMTRLYVQGEDPAFNPTGTKIAYADGGYNEDHGIYVMNADGSGSKLVAPGPGWPVPEGERVSHPVYSHDGSEIAYIRNGLIYRVAVSGGRSTLAVEGDTSDAHTLAAALAGSDPNPTQLPTVEAAEAAYLASWGSSSEGAGGGLSEIFEVLEAMNGWEREFCILHLGECKAFADDRNLALNARGALFTNRHKIDRSTRGNAFQHGIWTALMVRDSQGEFDGFPNGLVYALHHETKPYSWDARQDIVNDFVGYFWFLVNGTEEVSENTFKYVDRLKVCQGLLPKGKHAIFIGGSVNPFHWIHHHQYEFQRLIFRKLRSNNGVGSKVWPTGRTCAEVWPAIS